MKPLKAKTLCVGCRDNFYNGNNPYGVKECWAFKDAKVIKRKQVALDQNPPWNQEAHFEMSCKRVKGYVFVGPKVTQ